MIKLKHNRTVISHSFILAIRTLSRDSADTGTSKGVSLSRDLKSALHCVMKR
jgi:hypothetical protein